MADDPHPPEALLAHMDFVRLLARSLLEDQDEASDLEQDAWLRALEQPPKQRGNLRNWFAVMIRNLVRNRHRARRRRERHEAQAKPQACVDPTVEVVAREAARRKVVEAVLQLNEPYRTAIVRCYFDGLSAAAIAGCTGVSASTMRSRLRRALELLRQHLDGEHGMQRSAWAVPLAPLTWPAAWEGTGIASAPKYLLELMLMNNKLMLGTAAVVLCALGLGFVAFSLRDPEVAAPAYDLAAGWNEDPGSVAAKPKGNETALRESLVAAAMGPAQPPVYPRGVGRGAIGGIVTEPTGKPVAGATVHLS